MPGGATPQPPTIGPNVPRAHGPLGAALGRLTLRLQGWRIEGEIPDLPKFVIAVAPHTSNWDFLIGLSVKLALRLGARFVGKHTLFHWPLGALMRWLGGVPVDRGAAAGFVEDAVRVFRQSERLVLVVAPEGTRKRIERWRSGFYWIAVRAEVPILLGCFDYSRKVVSFGPLFRPTGDFEKDVADMRSRLTAGMALRPENFG